jgi:hypothetical protein
VLCFYSFIFNVEAGECLGDQCEIFLGFWFCLASSVSVVLLRTKRIRMWFAIELGRTG